ncbi:M28 family peptidase [Psychroflexus sp. ALD_RP9]|uniref:M28 family peptidase n=1 Tax=Psychroflexus sp. ALD_RP9 TaxID=2777186 RepID=UPI001A8D7F28|nr:M28 family peptidase [Psychroflexus sp. ALD_RP9]QSS96217.1 M28 family peptidase [Psychroflexus sp. ALD_RP9]
MKFIKQFFFTALLIVVVVAVYQSFSPQTEDSLNNPNFSLGNVKAHVTNIAKEPHYVGSTAHAKVSNYISQELTDIGIADVHTQQGFSLTDDGNLTIPENILGRIKATNPKPSHKAILLLSHYDSAPHSSYGASDAASGVAVIIESLRAFLATNPQFENDIIICFSDAEELGLNGAELFVRQHPWAKDVEMVLNFEARGSGGPSNMIVETNYGNAQIIKHVQNAGVNYPMANSLMYSVYKLLPNDTDSTVFREKADIPSLFFAFIDDHFDYHTSLDVPNRLDDTSLLHQADYLMHLIPEFASADLGLLNTSEDQVYVNFANLKLLSYSYSWSWPLLIIGLVLWLIVIYSGLQRQRFQLKDIGKSLILWFLLLIGLPLIATGIYYLIRAIYPQYQSILQGFTYNGHDYIWGIVFIVLALLISTTRYYQKKLGTAAIYTSFGLLAWCVCLVFNLALPGANYFILPLFFGFFGMFVFNLRLKYKRFTALVLGCPALVLFTPFIQFFPVGLGLSMLGLSALFIMLSFGFIQVAITSNLASRLSSYALVILAIVFFVKAHFSAEFTTERPRPNSLNYHVNLDQNQAYWLSYDTELDSYTSTYFSAEDTLISDSDFSSKYNSKATFMSGAPYIDFAKAKVKLDTLEETKASISYQLEIFPSPKTKRLTLNADQNINFLDFSINQLTADSIYLDNKAYHIFKKRFSNRLFDYYVVNQEPIKIKFSVDRSEEFNFMLHQINYDLLNEARLSVRPRKENQIPKPFIVNDAIICSQKIIVNEQ